MEPMLGGIYESRGPENSLEIEELAKFAIDDHNTKANALLEFHRVVNTKEQIVAGKMFYITLEAIDGGVKKVYEAKVWTKGWENFKQVQEFNYVADAPADGPSS